MIRLRWAAPVLLALNLLLLSACGGTTYNATPQISALAPSEITAGSQGFTLFVSGTNFISTSTAQWNGSPRPTTYNTDSTQLLVLITAADVQNAGLAQVTVTSPAPGGGSSLAVSFTVNPVHSGAPTITSLSPTSAALNGQAFTLAVTGTNFAAGDYVTWEGGLRTTTVTSSTQISARILATDLTQQMVAAISVHTPQLGVASPAVGFQVGSSPSASVKFPQVVSVNESGGPADAPSSSPAMSADGRYVAFYSEANNLVRGASGNVFVRDTCLGAVSCTPGTFTADVAADGSPPNAPASSHDPIAMSGGGRYVAFVSWATNLIPGGPAQARVPRIFVRDTCRGMAAAVNCVPRTELASLNPEGEAVEGHQPTLSGDGRLVAFTSPVQGGSSAQVVFVRDTCNGAIAYASCTPRTAAASLEGDDRIAVVDGAGLSLSANGRYVVFAGRLDAGRGEKAKNTSQIFVRDTCFGVSTAEACEPSSGRISVSPDGEFGNANSRSPFVSGDGRFVVFQSGASNLGGAPTGRQEIYLRDMCVGPTAPFNCVPSTWRVSAATDVSGMITGSYSPWISASGGYVSYMVQTEADDPLANAQGLGYIVLYDTCFGVTRECSPRVTELTSLDTTNSQVRLSTDVSMRVPLGKDGQFAAFFTNQTVPAAGLSGLGDVLLTSTPFQPHQR